VTTLAESLAIIQKMGPAELAEFDKLVEPELRAAWVPNPGPQTDAYLSKADLLLYGGAAGGGKTDLLIGLALTEHKRSVIFRRAYVDLRGVEERLLEIRGTRDGYNASDMFLRTDETLLEFGALEKPGAELSWQGRPHDLIAFDEGAQLGEAKVRFVMGWLRSARPGQRCRVVIASNPPIGGEGEWLVDWFSPWLDPLAPNPARPGELRWAVTAPDGKTIWVEGPGAHEIDGLTLEALSRSFIPAFLDDNPYLKDTGYRAQIMSMDEPLRSKLLNGDFLAGKEDAERQVIPSSWIEAAQERWKQRPKPAGRMLALGVDIAQGGKDKTVLAPLYGAWFDNLVRRPGVDTRDGPAVGGLIIEIMRDRCQITIDLTGGWGLGTKQHLQTLGIDVLGVVFSAASQERTKDGRLGFYNERAEMYWKFREALDPHKGDKICLPPDRGLAAQLGAATWKLRGDKILIESKDDIRDRLGMSPDDADAVILAWHKRDRALFMERHGPKMAKDWAYAEPEEDVFA
jgi:hypothetical protein